jgi:hypothetical protein
MLRISLVLFGVFCAASLSFTQETTDITVEAELSNNSDRTKVRRIQYGEILSNTGMGTSAQLLTLYDVLPDKSVVKTKKGSWLVSIPAGQRVRLKLKCRCLNKGLKLPSTASLRPTNLKVTKAIDLTSQKSTWDGVKDHRKILRFNCTREIRSNDCASGLSQAIEGIFKENAIDIENYKVLRELDEQPTVVMATTKLGIPVSLVNIRYNCLQDGERNLVFLKCDISAEENYHATFGRGHSRY